MLKKLWNWLKPRVRALFALSAPTLAQAALDAINDADIQADALKAVCAAAQKGLKDNEAFDAAVAALKEALAARGKTLKTCALDTLIQNAYLVFKFEK